MSALTDGLAEHLTLPCHVLLYTRRPGADNCLFDAGFVLAILLPRLFGVSNNYWKMRSCPTGRAKTVKFQDLHPTELQMFSNPYLTWESFHYVRLDNEMKPSGSRLTPIGFFCDNL